MSLFACRIWVISLKVLLVTKNWHRNNIDAILGGHTHTFMKEPAIYLNKDGKNVPVMHTGKSGIYVGMLKLTLTEEEEAQPSSK